jgi:hypothetical protein
MTKSVVAGLTIQAKAENKITVVLSENHIRT